MAIKNGQSIDTGNIGHMTQMFSAKLEITTILKGLMKIFYYNKILL
jgi:hypothetical protein